VAYGCWCNGKRIGGATIPPFTLLILTTILRDSGFEADFLDAQAEQISSSTMQSIIPHYDVIVISSSTMTFNEDADYLEKLKRDNKDIITIVFGSHPTFMPTNCLSHDGIDIIIKHEPEFILRDLIDLMTRKEDFSHLKGIGFKKKDQIVVNENYPLIENLDEIPFPDVDLLPKGIDYYNPIVKRTPYITTTTSKGCPGKCSFCTAPAFDGKRVRFQSADYVIDELNYFIRKGIKEVYFRDDTFFVNKKRDYVVCEYIIKNNLDITWLANTRIDMIDEYTIQLAKRAGCHTIKIGVESGNQEILNGIKKGYNLDQAHRVFEWARKAGMRTHAHVMIGNPGDTRETVAQTIDFVINLNPTTATFGICTPYPGTPLFQMVASRYPQIGDGSSSDLSKLHVEGLFNEYYTSLKKEELSRMVRMAYRNFYMRPVYWLHSIKWQLTSFDDIKRISIAATNIFDYIFRG